MIHDTGKQPLRSLVGNILRNSRGERIGRLVDLMIDVQEGRIAYVLASFDRPGAAGTLFAIPWEALNVDADRQTFVFDLDPRHLEGAPRFDRETAYPRPLWTPALPPPLSPHDSIRMITNPPVRKRKRGRTFAEPTPPVAFDPGFRVHR